jgi:hypothetical protein
MTIEMTLNRNMNRLIEKECAYERVGWAGESCGQFI